MFELLQKISGLIGFNKINHNKLIKYEINNEPNLVQAAEDSDFKLLKNLISQAYDLDYQNENHDTALSIVFKNILKDSSHPQKSDKNILYTLINAGAKITLIPQFESIQIKILFEYIRDSQITGFGKLNILSFFIQIYNTNITKYEDGIHKKIDYEHQCPFQVSEIEQLLTQIDFSSVTLPYTNSVNYFERIKIDVNSEPIFNDLIIIGDAPK